MNPVAFDLFGLQVRWYGILMASAMVLGGLLVLGQAKKKGYKEDDVYDLLLAVIPSAVIGARLWYVLFNLDYYGADFLKIINIRAGGMAIHGGILGGLIAGFVFCKVKKFNFAELADIGGMGVVLGQAIGRWGNFTNGEAHGGPTNLPWGIMVDGVKVHPTFLYESVWNLMVLAVLWMYKDKKKFNGELFLLYMTLYSVGRFMIEGLRTDSLMVGPFRTAQLVSMAFVAIGAVGILWGRQHQKKHNQDISE